MVKNEKSNMKDANELTLMKEMKQNLGLSIKASCSEGDHIVDSMLCDNATNDMVTASSREDGMDETVEVEICDGEDSQDDQGQKCEEKETMNTSGNPETNTASRSLWAPSIYYRPEKEIYHFVGYEISIYEALDSYGGMIWPGAVALCKYLETPVGRQQINLLDKSALEIGAGTGLVSIVATLHGAKVTATDLPEILGNLRWNLARNTKWRCRHPAQVAALSWGQELDTNFPHSTHHYDYVLAADVVYHHDYLNELLVTMGHFCQPGTTLIWSNKIRYQSDLGFIERFEDAFHTTVLEEKDDIRIYMATAREVQKHSGQMMQSEQVQEHSGQMMEMKLGQEHSCQQMEIVELEEKDQNVKKEEDVYVMEDVMKDKKPQVLQKRHKQRCSVEDVEGNKEEIKGNKKYKDKNENTKTDTFVGHKQRDCDFVKKKIGAEIEIGALDVCISHQAHNIEDFIRTETSKQSVTPNKASHHTPMAKKETMKLCEVTSQESQKRNNNMIEMTPDGGPLDTKKTLKDKEDESHNTGPENKQEKWDKQYEMKENKQEERTDKGLTKHLEKAELKTNVSHMYGDSLANNMLGKEEHSATEVNHENAELSGESCEDEDSCESEETVSDDDVCDSNGTAQQEEEKNSLKTSEKHDFKPAYQNTWSPGVICRPNKEIYSFAGYDICIHESLDSDSMISPGEVALCKYLETPTGRQQLNLLDKSVIEIGAGTGLVSAVATLLGAKVTATDLPEILGNLRCNLARNTKWRCRHPAQVVALSWGQELETNFPHSTHHYDYVLAADVVYHHDYLNEVLITMRHFCQSGATLIWCNNMSYLSNLDFVEHFKEAFLTTLLTEEDGIRIYMATARETHQDESGPKKQAVKHEEKKNQTIKDENLMAHNEMREEFQEVKKQRCSDEEVQSSEQERRADKKSVDENVSKNTQRKGNDKIKTDESEGHKPSNLGTEKYCAPELGREENDHLNGGSCGVEGAHESEEKASDDVSNSRSIAQQEQGKESLKTSENHDTKALSKSIWSPNLYYRPEKEIYHFVGYEICIHESLDSYGSMIWPGAVALCKYLETSAGQQQVNLLDKSVIEIGAGTGLVSIVATLHGAKVTATDLPEILGNLRCNLARNTKCRCRHPAQVAALSWGQELDTNFPHSTHHYDYVLAADVVYHHDYLNELLVTMGHFCQPGTTLIWSNKVRYQSDLGFIERFEDAFHTTVLEEKDEIRIYMATAREVQKHSGQMMRFKQVQEHSGQMMQSEQVQEPSSQMMEMKLLQEDSEKVMQTVKHREEDHKPDSGQKMQLVEHDHSLQDEKDKTVKEEKNVCSTEDILTHKIEAFQEGKEQRCSNEEVEVRQQEINEEKKYQHTNFNYMKHVKKENSPNGEEEGEKIQNVDSSKLLIPYCSDTTKQNDTETEIHHFLGYEIAVRGLLTWNRGNPGPATLALCKFLETQQMDLQGKSVLELGAGTGLVSIVASMLGAWVTATEQKEVLEILVQNLAANTKGRSKFSPQAEVLRWGHNLARSFPLSIYQYDYILAADVVYGHSHMNELLDTMCHFCQRDTTLLWAHEFCHRSDMTFKAQFKRALHTKLLVELGDVKIYMGKSKRTRMPNWRLSLY